MAISANYHLTTPASTSWSAWETIEHIDEGDRALTEFKRVLRPDGILLVSSPNPGVYPPGSDFHIHEYTPQELRRRSRLTSPTSRPFASILGSHR